ncbi:putative dehydrin [Forsythia ovata]|uniref:Dehydrin n=1 Tax=Forsythia ovata TaxID=205694 RepID=A0ABD1WSM8_9LAMI
MAPVTRSPAHEETSEARPEGNFQGAKTSIIRSVFSASTLVSREKHNVIGIVMGTNSRINKITVNIIITGGSNRQDLQQEAQYPHHHNIEKKSDEPRDEGVAAPIKFDDYAAPVEATDRGLFDFVWKKEEKNKCEEEVIATQFEEKVKVSKPEYKKEEETKEGEKKHKSLLQKLNRSNSSSSSVSCSSNIFNS